MTPTIVIVVPCLHKFDAIGTDVLLQQECLEAAGLHAVIYAEQCDPHLASRVIPLERYRELIANENNLIIYHFGVFWHALPELLAQAKARLWVKYHNITPPEFFSGWDAGSFHATSAGQNQVKWLTQQDRIELFVCDSAYNATELTALTENSRIACTVLAPFVQLLADEQFDDTNTPIDQNILNILFVGRVVPNKAHKHLLGTVRSFRDFFPNRPIKLHIAGAISSNFQNYFSFLSELAAKTLIKDDVIFWDKIPAQTLRGLYLKSSVFLCMSEHEGFCVPVVEAQQSQLPILALSRAAVPDTLGDDQLLMSGEVDYDHAACLIHEVVSNQDLRQHLVQSGQRNAERFSKKTLSHQLLQLVRSHF